MLLDIGWDTLEERRAKARAYMIYRIKHEMVDIPAVQHLVPLGIRSRQGEFRVPYARTASYQRSFFPDGIRIWNALPRDLVAAESLDILKSRLTDHNCAQRVVWRSIN